MDYKGCEGDYLDKGTSVRIIVTPRELAVILFLINGKIDLTKLGEIVAKLSKNGVEILGELYPEIEEFVTELKAFGLVEINGNEVVLKMEKVPVELLEELHNKLELVEEILKKEEVYISTTN
ncbi:hypothetical protein EYM_06760 [Ignicoccus islandicus DSM 13165]|uniref:Uncharacterized protein n=1 Tax=Ignicoccus islandicus DSM 13165 TaxID=940295 RepID=A0A0U3EBL3_9CREN|nr:hypothetical protein [Ignicoccus islandicus]ALU12718.1 hypothetical protein EYM_06760 [Ignicoccus islandicus DSM 13165]